MAIAITGLCGLVYLAGQQNLRMSANDPQIQIAQDTGQLLQQGDDPKVLVRQTQTELSQSLATFIMIFDNNGNPVTSSGLFFGKMLKPPTGVFGFAKKHLEDRFTWEPMEGFRFATVVTSYFGPGGKPSGFVLAGRNLREVEKREDQLLFNVFIAWAAIMAATLVSTLIFVPISHKK